MTAHKAGQYLNNLYALFNPSEIPSHLSSSMAGAFSTLFKVEEFACETIPARPNQRVAVAAAITILHDAAITQQSKEKSQSFAFVPKFSGLFDPA